MFGSGSCRVSIHHILGPDILRFQIRGANYKYNSFFFFFVCANTAATLEFLIWKIALHVLNFYICLCLTHHLSGLVFRICSVYRPRYTWEKKKKVCIHWLFNCKCKVVAHCLVCFTFFLDVCFRGAISALQSIFFQVHL